jgi:hypothetical protein
MTKEGFFVMAFSLLANLSTSVTKEPVSHDYLVTAASPIIQEELGLALLPNNLLAQSSEHVFQSVFLKLMAPAPPENVCNLTCSPNMDEIQKMFTPRDGCWISKMVVVRAAVLEESREEDVSDCFLRCLLNSLCGLLTYDERNEQCTLQTGNFYRVNAIDSSLTSSSALLRCILKNNGVTKASLCRNENLLFSSVLNAIMTGHQNWVQRLLPQFKDVKRAYDQTCLRPKVI